MSEMPPIDPAPTPVAPAPFTGLPWEGPSAGLGSIFPTALRFIAAPIEAYTAMSLTVDLVRPIAYFVALALIGACIGQIWSYLLFDTIIKVVRPLLGSQFEQLSPFIHPPGVFHLSPTAASHVSKHRSSFPTEPRPSDSRNQRSLPSCCCASAAQSFLVLGLVVTPLVALIALFIWSALVHLMLVLFGGANRGFATTLRVMCYAQTTQLAVVLPGIGGLIAIVWRLVLEIAGLATAHKTDGWKAALAIILPLFLCCVCVAAGLAAFGAALGQALQNLK